MSRLVSVIIPAYNASRYIGETIRSVQAQTYTNWELIVIDDGSTDNTPAIVKEFLTDNRISYYHQKNSGVSAARNYGLEKAKGDYIAFIDADDLMHPENLNEKASLLDARNEIDYVFSDLTLCDESSQVTGRIECPGIDRPVDILLWEKRWIDAPCSNMLARRKCFDGLRFDTQLSTAADKEFMIRFSMKFKGTCINKPLIIYRVLSSSMSRNIALMEKDELYLYRKAEQNNWFASRAEKQKAFSNMYLVLAGSWWVNGSNKSRAMKFMIRSVMAYPANIKKLLTKFSR